MSTNNKLPLEPSVLAFMRREDLEYFLRREPEMGLYLRTPGGTTAPYGRSDVEHCPQEVPARLASPILQLLSQEGIVVRGGDYAIPTPTLTSSWEPGQEPTGWRNPCFRAAPRQGVVELRQPRIHVRNLKALRRRLMRPLPSQAPGIGYSSLSGMRLRKTREAPTSTSVMAMIGIIISRRDLLPISAGRFVLRCVAASVPLRRTP
jgi:hypothetical protein